MQQGPEKSAAAYLNICDSWRWKNPERTVHLLAHCYYSEMTLCVKEQDSETIIRCIWSIYKRRLDYLPSKCQFSFT
jgi:hypothetical protein